MKIILALLLLSISACTTVGVHKSSDDLKTLTLMTGSKGAKLYTSDYIKKASEVCPDGFDILETTKTPSTMPKEVLDDYHFYWVIKCT